MCFPMMHVGSHLLKSSQIRVPTSHSDFAGKEAVVKAFGTGFAGIDACEVEILRRESGAPYVTLYGAARKKAEEMGITDWKISITNTKEVATAFVIAVADDVKE